MLQVLRSLPQVIRLPQIAPIILVSTKPKNSLAKRGKTLEEFLDDFEGVSREQAESQSGIGWKSLA